MCGTLSHNVDGLQFIHNCIRMYIFVCWKQRNFYSFEWNNVKQSAYKRILHLYHMVLVSDLQLDPSTFHSIQEYLWRSGPFGGIGYHALEEEIYILEGPRFFFYTAYFAQQISNNLVFFKRMDSSTCIRIPTVFNSRSGFMPPH